MLKTCSCRPSPLPYVAPHKAHLCVRCNFVIPAEWTSNDTTVGAFYDLLADSLPGADIEQFRSQSQSRERAGREKFGHRHLGRDNIAEALEEATDGANYCLFESLSAKREKRTENLDLALTAAAHFYKAHEALLHLKQRRGGAP